MEGQYVFDLGLIYIRFRYSLGMACIRSAYEEVPCSS